MIDFEYRFPLFDSIMVGSLSPFLPENNYSAYLNEENDRIGLDSILDEGRVGFTFYKPANFKCRYYYHKLVKETFYYCNDILQYLEEEQDADTRAYLRLTLLDKHLKTCLIKIGETIHSSNLSTQHFLQPLPETDSELLSNSYIFHLLKVCVAKAYLEVQLALSDVIHNPLTETMLYTAIVGELPPIKCFLKHIPVADLQQRSLKDKDTTITKTITKPLNSTLSDEENTAAMVDTKLHTVKDLIAMKIGSDRTIRRMLERKEIIGIKQKNGWRIEDAELQHYLTNLKIKNKDKTKP
jgi:hypothetical protein